MEPLTPREFEGQERPFTLSMRLSYLYSYISRLNRSSPCLSFSLSLQTSIYLLKRSSLSLCTSISLSLRMHLSLSLPMNLSSEQFISQSLSPSCILSIHLFFLSLHLSIVHSKSLALRSSIPISLSLCVCSHLFILTEEDMGLDPCESLERWIPGYLSSIP